MKKSICLFVLLIASLSVASAQDYNWGMGVRLGGEMAGATVKYKFNASNAFETIVATPWRDGFTFTLLYQRHIPIIDQGFHFYYGFGGHVGEIKREFALGVDGVLGLEYKFRGNPLLLSVDYKPMLNIVRKTRFYMGDLALGIKVAF